jgi:hypothetical protein
MIPAPAGAYYVTQGDTEYPVVAFDDDGEPLIITGDESTGIVPPSGSWWLEARATTPPIPGGGWYAVLDDDARETRKRVIAWTRKYNFANCEDAVDGFIDIGGPISSE